MLASTPNSPFALASAEGVTKRAQELKMGDDLLIALKPVVGDLARLNAGTLSTEEASRKILKHMSRDYNACKVGGIGVRGLGWTARWVEPTICTPPRCTPRGIHLACTPLTPTLPPRAPMHDPPHQVLAAYVPVCCDALKAVARYHRKGLLLNLSGMPPLKRFGFSNLMLVGAAARDVAGCTQPASARSLHAACMSSAAHGCAGGKPLTRQRTAVAPPCRPCSRWTAWARPLTCRSRSSSPARQRVSEEQQRSDACVPMQCTPRACPASRRPCAAPASVHNRHPACCLPAGHLKKGFLEEIALPYMASRAWGSSCSQAQDAWSCKVEAALSASPSGARQSHPSPPSLYLAGPSPQSLAQQLYPQECDDFHMRKYLSAEGKAQLLRERAAANAANAAGAHANTVTIIGGQEIATSLLRDVQERQAAMQESQAAMERSQAAKLREMQESQEAFQRCGAGRQRAGVLKRQAGLGLLAGWMGGVRSHLGSGA